MRLWAGKVGGKLRQNTKKRWLKIAVNEHICMWHKTTGQQKKYQKKQKSLQLSRQKAAGKKVLDRTFA